MTLDESIQLSEARLVLRWAAQTLTERQCECLTGFLLGEFLSTTGKRLGISKESVFEYRNTALAKLRERLYSLGISRCADLLSSADVKPEQKPPDIVARKERRKRRCLDITKGKCKRGHERAIYCHRKPSGKTECIACKRLKSKTTAGRAAQNKSTRSWRAKVRASVHREILSS